MAQEKEKRGRSRDRGEKRREPEGYEAIIEIKRCASVVKGGRRFSFNALVVVGDKKSSVGIGYGKATEVPPAVDKAVKDGNKNMKKIKLRGGTIPHRVIGKFKSARVIMIPASPGTGVIAGRGIRDVLIACGVTDVLTKVIGTTNPINAIKAALEGLTRLRTREEVAELRGVTM